MDTALIARMSAGSSDHRELRHGMGVRNGVCRNRGTRHTLYRNQTVEIPPFLSTGLA
jgi:hypothetical protein